MDVATYRCINETCGRGFPRQVNFCPFCGAPQNAAVRPRPAPVQAAQAASRHLGAGATAAEPMAGGAAGAATDGAARYASTGRAVAPDEEAVVLSAEQIAAAKARLDKARGAPPAGAASGAAAGQPARPAAGAPPKAPAAGGSRSGRPMREPIGITTWLLVAGILAVIWYLAKPANEQERIDKHADQALALMADCKLDAARAEVAAMRAAKASDLQIRKANDAIGSAVKTCEMKRQRAKAWTDLTAALDSALQSGAVERADARLAAFTKKWGADDATRDWDKRIDIKKAERLLDEADACLRKSDRACLEAKLVAAEKLERAEVAGRIRSLREALSKLLEATVLEQQAPPALSNEAPRGVPQREAVREVARAAPPVISTAPQVSQAAAQARKILSDAERELNQGNYKSAMDKAEICATMIDIGNRECLGLKQRAERLNREMLRCVASGADWINDRCQ